jgi:glycosyltransferase involved in cell wall biosynthesis
LKKGKNIYDMLFFDNNLHKRSLFSLFDDTLSSVIHMTAEDIVIFNNYLTNELLKKINPIFEKYSQKFINQHIPIYELFVSNDYNINNNFFPNIDIFLMPSIRETFGLVMLEAIKYGKPVITTNTDGANTIFDKQSALFVDFNKPVVLQFSNHIIYLLENPKSLETLVANSKNRLYDKFSFDCLQENLQSIISKIYHL